MMLNTSFMESVELQEFCMVFHKMTACLVQWLARLTAIQEVPGSIPGYTLEIFLEVQGLEWGPPSLVRTIGQLLDMRSSEIRLRKLKLRLRDKCFANHKAPVLPFGSNRFSRSWFFGAVAPQIYYFKVLQLWSLFSEDRTNFSNFVIL